MFKRLQLQMAWFTWIVNVHNLVYNPELFILKALE